MDIKHTCPYIDLRSTPFLHFRQTVRDVMEAIQPGRMANARKGKLSRRLYRNKGPNHLIHLDGYDKLSPFGFYIHGAIDGWSRKLLWLEVASTNKAAICDFKLLSELCTPNRWHSKNNKNG